ncbi:MAG: cystathionine beta-synthase, partial [Bacteroidota bacterium]
VGSVQETDVLNFLLANPLENSEQPVSAIMRAPFPEVPTEMTLAELGKHITKENPAVVTTDRSGRRHLVAQYDVLRAI